MMRKIVIFFTFFATFIGICRASYFVETDTVDVVRYYGEGFEPSGYDVASGDSVITYSGTFKFKKLNSNDSITFIVDFQPINTASQLCSVIISGDKKLMTKQDTVISLSAISDDPMDFYKWYALEDEDNDNFIGDKTLDNIKVTVHPNDTAVYILETMKEEEDNLVYNGDFEEGNKGFWTQYNYTTEAHGTGYDKGLGPEGRYAVGENPKYYHQNFCDYSASDYDKMLIANGSQGVDKIVYAATFDVEPHQNYIVSFDASTVAPCSTSELPRLQFSVTGEKLGDVFTTNSTNCVWDQYYQIWNSGDDTTATITILNQNTNTSGNDFAIDNITLRKMCTSYDTIIIINDIKLYDTIDVAICEGEAYDFNGEDKTETGEYTAALKTANDIDSLVTLNLTVNPVYEIHLDTTICDGDYFIFNGQTISQQGDYKSVLKTEKDCDSVVYISVNVIATQKVSIEEEIYSWQDYYFNDEKMSHSGTYTANLKNENGCDSIVTLNLIVNDKVYIDKDICQGEEYVLGDNILTKEGTYYDTLKAANGNDSVVVLTLRVRDVMNDTIFATISEGTVYTRQGFEETQSGTYTHENTSIYGCDSSLVLVLTVVKDEQVWVPTAFTPKSDNNNEFFVIIEDENVVSEYLRIYNRWGTIVFETTDITQKWDGRYKGEVCDQGVYMYELIYQVKGFEAKSYRKSGNFMLLN